MPKFSEALPDATAEQQVLLLNQLKMIDPEKEGVDASRLRTFYPKLGWNSILQVLYACVDAGTVKKRRDGRLDVYTWL